MSYINSFEVLNLPDLKNGSNWKIWDRVAPDGKNALFIWDMATGKSTILDLLHESIDRCDRVLNSGVSTMKKWPFIQFKNHCPEDYEHFLGGHDNYFHERDELWNELNSNSENIEFDIFSNAMTWVYALWTMNIWDPRFTAVSSQLETVLEKYYFESKDDSYHPEDERKRDWVTAGNQHEEYLIPNSSYMDLMISSAKIFAKRQGIPEEVIYGNLVLMVQSNHDLLKSDLNWGHIKPEGKNILLPNRIVYKPENKEKWNSGWEMVKKVLSEVKWKTIAFLEQPLNELDRNSKIEARAFLLDWLDNWTQVFMESHDEPFIDMAEKSNKWLVHDLGEKKINEQTPE